VAKNDMREIKFRAWDKVEKVWYDWESGALEYEKDHHSKKHGTCVVAYFDLIEDFVLMQFTGLHDKNGKEIYEGDIIVQGDRTFTIEWGVEDAAFWKANIQEEGRRYFYTRATAKDCEVIGNIYENPELLV